MVITAPLRLECDLHYLALFWISLVAERCGGEGVADADHVTSTSFEVLQFKSHSDRKQPWVKNASGYIGGVAACY